MIDRRGDSKNVEYGGLHRYSIPSYHRIGYGSVLGASKYVKIDRDAGTEKVIVLRIDRGKGGERAERLLTRKSAKHEGRGQRLIVPQAGDSDTSMSMQTDFLALRPALKRKRGSESPDAGVLNVDYRSVEGKAKPDPLPHDEDVELESSSDEASHSVTTDAAITAHNADLSRATKFTPTDINTWLALIEHQAQLMFPDVHLDDLTSSQRRIVADVRLSIFDQAFKFVLEQHPHHDRLLALYIKEGSRIWDAPKLAQKWKQALKQHSSSQLLWTEYLDYVQTDPANFRYEKCRDQYLQCLETLTTHGKETDPEEQQIIAKTITYVLLRLTSFTKDAGYGELAIATWQAVLEYYVFAPEALQGQSRLEAFEEFWESDVPRIGEENAVGWRASTGSTASRKPSHVASPTVESQKPYARFARTESSMNKAFFLPAATADEEDESDDPFRYVMFSDIEPILERLPGHLDVEMLVQAFLIFMGLPPADRENALSQDRSSDLYLQDGRGRVTTQRHDSLSLFYRDFHSRNLPEEHDFIHRALSALTQAIASYEELGEYLLAFLTCVNPSQTKKAAKRLIKQRPTSLRYYNAFALAEARVRGTGSELEKAVGIWKQALTLADSLPDDARDETILLWHSWMMTLNNSGGESAALRLLLLMPDGATGAVQSQPSTASAGTVLRSKRHLEEGFDRMHLKRRHGHTALYADCLAWLRYLSADYDVKAALTSFATTATRLKTVENKRALELLHQAKARLLGCHIKARRPFKPTVFRDELAESKRLFPENSAMLSRYYEVARRTRLEDRLRDALSEAGTASSTSPSGLVSWTFAIDAEIDRCSVDGASATKDSVRALFRRALLAVDSTVKHSSLLWRKWFEFESATFLRVSKDESVQRQQAVRNAKQVFFNGLQFLPWNKRWIVDGMAFLVESGDMVEEELRRIHGILVERELRLRLDVDAA